MDRESGRCSPTRWPAVRHGLFAVVAGLLLSQPAWAQPETTPATPPPAAHDSPQPSGKEPMLLSLDQAIRRTLDHNLELQIVQETRNAAETDPTVERAKFDPSLNVNVNGGRTLDATGYTNSTSVDLSLSQPVITGSTLSLDYNNDWTKTNSNFYFLQFGCTPPSCYQSTLQFKLTQPLLKGGGLAVNRAPILIAANNAALSKEAVTQKTAEVVANVERAYWDLVLQRKILQVRQEALRAAQSLLAAARAKVEQGVLAPIEALVAESGAASREEDVVVAERAAFDAQDRLRRLFSTGAGSLMDESAIIPTDEPEVEPREIDLQTLVAAALDQRPELAQAKLDMSNSRLNLALAQNQRWPTLDLQASVGLSGLGNTVSDGLTSGDFYLWQAGLTLTVPLGNRAAYATMLKRRFEMERAALTLKDKEQGIILDVKEAARGLLTNAKRADVTRQARQLAEKKLEAEETRFQLGLTTVQDVLTFERDLADAKRAEVNALVDYRNSLVDLDERTGRLLERHHVMPLSPPS